MSAFKSACDWCGGPIQTDSVVHWNWCSQKCFNESERNREFKESKSVANQINQLSRDDQAVLTLMVIIVFLFLSFFFLPYLIYGWMFLGDSISPISLLDSITNIWAWVFNSVFWIAITLIILVKRKI